MEHILSISYGKDSLACLGAIEKLKWPLDKIMTVDVWATETICADLPEMVEFKSKTDEIIKRRYGIIVEHIRSEQTYEEVFFRIRKNSKIGNNDKIYGWPVQISPWCNGELKMKTIRKFNKENKGCINYIGIAYDEPKRFQNLNELVKSPLVELKWTENDAKQWCIKNDLLSPIYKHSNRGGCWFCHNQRTENLRYLRHNYSELWGIMLKWDAHSTVPFKLNGHSLHDYEKRFKLEDEGFLIPGDKKFKWSMLEEELNYKLF